jgi:hypothetical protein
LEAIERERRYENQERYRAAAFVAYLTTPNPDHKTFGDFALELGLGGDASQDDAEYEAATEDEIREAMAVCAEADALAAAGAYRKVSGVNVIRATGVLRG